uniref:BEACH-type PH domain-containing protein n=1 Tax=Heterorhabditis bacteriophora TaxID=37862 RepID=A0A1I7XKG3_HETBA
MAICPCGQLSSGRLDLGGDYYCRGVSLVCHRRPASNKRQLQTIAHSSHYILLWLRDRFPSKAVVDLESTCFSTAAKLISPGIIIPGTLSITATDLYFDADEDHPLYKEQDPKVRYVF